MASANVEPDIDLERVGPGFGNEALGSQAVFRAALRALAEPGRLQRVTSDACHPEGGAPAAAALLLALLDPDCTLWLAPSLARGSAQAWLRFHTGCRIVRHPQEARFAWADARELPDLSEFAQGSEFDPETSTTCIVQVDALSEDASGWCLRGPGIREQRGLRVDGLGREFVAQWRANARAFPAGIDVLLCAGEEMAGLARTTRIED